MKKILFVCVENAGRSQMAEAFARVCGRGKTEAHSAGTIPAKELNPVVVQAMNEKGIDLSNNRPKIITEEMVSEADLIVTMGCSIEQSCPALFLKGKKLVDLDLEDPKGKSKEKVREIRDDIEERVKKLL